jgi:hypothetical protein
MVFEDCKAAVEGWLYERAARKEWVEALKDEFRSQFRHRKAYARRQIRTLKEYRELQMNNAKHLGYEKPLEPMPFWPLSIVRVIDAQVSSTLRSSGSMVIADVLCNDGVVRRAKACHSYWSGSRMEPPEEDCEVIWFEPPTISTP